MRSLLSIFFVLQVIVLFAQEPTHFVDSTGALYWKKSQPVYLFVADAPTGEDPQRLTSKATPQYAEPFYLDTEGVNFIRSREAVDPKTMRPVPDTEVKFEIYADGIPPVSKLDIAYDTRYGSNQVFYGGVVTISLSSRDNLTGLSRLMYSINGEEPVEYVEPVALNDREITFQYYGIDKVGNIEEPKTQHFYIDTDIPYSDLNVNGITEDNVIALTSKLYIQAEDSTSGIAVVYYKFDGGEYLKYSGKTINISSLGEGDHSITYYAKDHIGNEEEPQTFKFYLDRSAPLMVADVLGDRFIVGDEIYFSGRTKLKLTAVDNKVGVKEIMYSIDGQEFIKYEQPFYLPSVAGIHNIKYYSVDNLNNSTSDSRKSHFISRATAAGRSSASSGYEEYKHNVNKFYVDLTGPLVDHAVLNHSFVREDTLFIGPQTKIKFTGKDSESGMNKFAYSFKSDVGEEAYTEPFSITDQKDGYYTLQYFGYDNVNNRNVSEFSFYYDGTLPEIFTQFNTGSLEGSKIPTYPVTSGLFLSATDQTSGIKSLSYNLDDSAFLPYQGLISGFTKGKHTMVIRAVDYLNNAQESTIEFRIR